MNLRDLHFQKTRGLFITGTDTGVGKTLITGGIAKILKQYNLKVGRTQADCHRLPRLNAGDWSVPMPSFWRCVRRRISRCR